MTLTATIRASPDYPKPGIVFRDITTLLGDAAALRYCIDALTAAASGLKVTKVAGTEARGFILGGAVAHQLGADGGGKLFVGGLVAKLTGKSELLFLHPSHLFSGLKSHSL